LAFCFANADILLEVSTDGRVVFACGALSSLLGCGQAALIGRPLLDRFPAEEKPLVRRLVGAMAANSRLGPILVTISGKSGETPSMVLAGYRLEAGSGNFFLTLSRPQISTIEGAGRHRDSETGLLDQDGFQEALTHRTGDLARVGSDSALTLIKLDHMESLQSSLGPEETARMMGEIGGLLRSHAIDGQTAGRLSDNRYGILRRPDTDTHALERELQVIADQMAPGHDSGVRVSGTSIDVPPDELGDDTAAKVLLYAVNRFAQDDDRPFTISSFREGFREMLSDTVADVVRLRETLESRGFSVALQPIVGLGDRAVHHFEALSRFPETVSPAETVSLAENVGMALKLDLIVLERVIEILLSARHGGMRPLIAVNVSAASLEDRTFIEAVERLLNDHPDLRPQIYIEITESMQIRDIEQANLRVRHLRAAGHKVCLDDFGAGSASFRYIKALDVDFVKIDGAYIKQAVRDRRDEAILKAMIVMCRTLGIFTIAEFVETEDQATKLREMGVDYGQGYLFGRPSLDVEALIALATHRGPARTESSGRRPRMMRRGAVESWE